MNPKQLYLLRCPDTGLPLSFKDTIEENGKIKEGLLIEPKSGNTYPIKNFIPRFVDTDNYASNFGFQWNLHNKTQLDSSSNFSISKNRFTKETRWGEDLKGLYILEAGSGSGRFTMHAVETGAMVVSFDYSNAVEANYKNNGHYDNLLIVQADIYKMPFEKNFFDNAFCLGVLQHTPNPKQAFFDIVKHIKPGGKICSDIYAKNLTQWFLQTKYYIRPFVKHIEPSKLYKLLKKYIDFMWPLAKIIRKIPKLGSMINTRLLIADYSQSFLKGANDSTLKQWAYLDTFDMLSPKYDLPQSLQTFKKWYKEAGLTNIDVHYGYNGIEGRARKI